MDLSHRPTTLKDLDACLPLIRNGFAFGPDERPHLLALWRHLLMGDMAESSVVEDRDKPAGQRIVGFGLDVFVTDEFVEEARTCLPPYQARHVLERWRAGHPPFLNAAQIRRANSGAGLNVAIIHYGWESGSQPGTAVSEVGHKSYESFLASHMGYRLKHIQEEAYGELHEQLFMNCGCHRETDYAAFFADGFPPPPPGYHPYLMGISAAETQQQVHHPLHVLFLSPPPRLFFRPAEQALLRGVLRGEGDAKMAAALCVSPFTIQKRWRSIFERVKAQYAGLLPTGFGSYRGQEKRGILLRYLQDHPEELRPVMPPPRAGRG